MPANPPSIPNPLAALKASYSALSGTLTRQINRFDRIKDLDPTPASLANVIKWVAAAEKAFAKMEEVVLEMVNIDPDILDRYQTKLAGDSQRFDDFAQAAADLLDSAPAAPAPNVNAPPPVQHQNVRVVHDLNPGKLSIDNTPAELHLWSEAFKAYFSASKLDRLPTKDQHAFIYACMDADLFKRVRPHVLATTPVFEDEDHATSILELIEDTFLHRYPLVQRRFDFFHFPHSAGQLASSWISDLRMKGDVAELEDLTTDELFAYRVITGVQDSELQGELLKLNKPSLRDVEAAVLLYEAKLSTREKTSVKRVQTAPSSYRGPSRRGAGSSGSSSNTSGGTSGRCARCNRASHNASRCTLPRDITCHQCGRRGHIATACRSAAARTVTDEAAEGNAVQEHQEIPEVRILETKNKPTPRLNLTFRQKDVVFDCLALPDSGATRTIVAQDLVDRYGLILDGKKEVIIVANGDQIRCAGSLPLTVSFQQYPGITAEIDALVTPDIRSDILLSWHDMKSLKILHENFPFPIVRAISAPALNKLFESYADVVSDTLGSRCLEGPPMTIHLRKDLPVIPFKIYTTKQVPLHLQVEADAAVQRALDDGVICRESGPTDWCCRGGFVPKPNGKLRLITDFIPLNKYVVRPVHPFPSALEIVQSVAPDSIAFAVLDCTMGYYQVPLEEESSKLTTFLLPQGRFRYKRAPMGLSASSDEFCRRSDEAIAGLPGVHKLVDDILIQAPSVDILCQRLHQLLDRCRRHGLTLSRRKAQFALGVNDPPVKYAGYLISARGVQPDPDKTNALQEFPRPKSVTELRSFLGLANQLGSFVPDLAHLTSRMRLLLKKGVAYVWNEDMDKDFDALKKVLSSNLIVYPFDPTLKTQLLTDASRVGLGFALMQISSDGTPRLIQCGSRSLISAETRYATIELECLAVVYAMSKCNFYLRGLRNFQLITDHRPLVGLFDKCLTDVSNPRIQRFREKIATYTFQAIWVAGKSNNIADALSRAPYFMPDGLDYAILSSVEVEDVRMQEMAKVAAEDSEYQKILQILLEGLSVTRAKLHANHPAHGFSNVWDRLSVSSKLIILDGSRLVPPVAMRSELLQKLHAPHLGVVRTRKQAQQLYYWPDMNNQIRKLIEACSVCQMLQPTQRAEPQIHTQAQFPMQDISVDPFEYGGLYYLLMVDRFSGYIWIDKLSDRCTGGVLKILLSWFLEYGFPTSIRSDGGPQFRSEFGEFCIKYGIRHDVSSPLYPEANGHAEANVKAAKHLLIKCLTAKEDLRFALMELRNTPRDDGYSPAQLFHGRRQRTLLPCVPKQLSDSVNLSTGMAARESAFHAKQMRAEQRAHLLSPLVPGQTIIMQDARTKRWQERGKILSVVSTGRSYWIRLSNGKVLWRNRRYLRPVGPLVLSSASSGPAPVANHESKRNLRPSKHVNYRDNRPYKGK